MAFLIRNSNVKRMIAFPSATFSVTRRASRMHRSRTSTTYQGGGQKQSNHQDSIPGGTTIRRDQTGVPCGLCQGNNQCTSPRKMSLLVFFIQRETVANDKTTDRVSGSDRSAREKGR